MSEETISFHLTKAEIEALIRWHLVDNEGAEGDSIDDLYEAFEALGGGPIELTDAGEEVLDIHDRLALVEEAVERDFEEQYPSHWKMLFDHGNSIDALFERVKALEAARSAGWNQYQGTGYQGYIR